MTDDTRRNKKRGDCAVCQRGSSAHPNPLLCGDCQAWDAITHLTVCQQDEYPRINPGVFSNDSSISEVYEDVDNGSLDNLVFHQLDAFSSTTGCVLHTKVGELLRARLGGLVDVRVATWRPFPCIGQQMIESTFQRGHGISTKFVLPVCIATGSTQDGKTTYRTFVLELEVLYAQDGYDLRDVKAWDRTRIEIEYIQQWLAYCQKHHGTFCNEHFLTSNLPQLFRLVDTNKWCVKQVQEPVKYVALSYVWAAASTTSHTKGTKPLQLDTSNVKELEGENALRSHQVPELITDAIQLCADLGYRYLWIDRLCIVQDGEAEKQEQLEAMDAIYHRATMAIVALGQGSAMGLQGVSCRPRQMTLNYKPWQLGIDGEFSGATVPGIHSAVSHSQWKERGWTFQEWILSRRQLFIDDSHFYLNCYVESFEPGSRFRDKDPEGANSNHSDSYPRGYGQRIRKKTNSPECWSFDAYQRAAEEYTARKLIYDQDVLDAFTGVGNAISAEYETPMLFGLPEKYFLQSLLWRHKGSWSQRELPSKPTPPSWSWAAWKGTVEYGQVHWNYQGLHSSSDLVSEAHIGGLVKFYYADPQRGLRAIQDVRIFFTRRGLDPGADEVGLPSKYADIILNRAFERWRSTGGTASVQMWRDCVHSPWEADQHSNIEDGAPLAKVFPGTLIFRTTFTFLTLEEFFESNTDSDTDSGPPTTQKNFNLIDDVGNTVGQTFRMSREESLQIFKPGRPYGVAVLCACITHRSYSRNQEEARWGLVVMVVDKQGCVSRRLGLGVVNPRAWTKLKPQWEIMVLA